MTESRSMHRVAGEISTNRKGRAAFKNTNGTTGHTFAGSRKYPGRSNLLRRLKRTAEARLSKTITVELAQGFRTQAFPAAHGLAHSIPCRHTRTRLRARLPAGWNSGR